MREDPVQVKVNAFGFMNRIHEFGEFPGEASHGNPPALVDRSSRHSVPKCYQREL